MDLYILEDEDMIRALGRDKFVDLSIHGSQGWQNGVSAHFIDFRAHFVPFPLVHFIYIAVN